MVRTRIGNELYWRSLSAAQAQAHAIAEKQTAPLSGEYLANNLTVDHLVKHHEQPDSARENRQDDVPEPAYAGLLGDNSLCFGPGFNGPTIVDVLGNYCIKSIHALNLTDSSGN